MKFVQMTSSNHKHLRGNSATAKLLSLVLVAVFAISLFSIFCVRSIFARDTRTVLAKTTKSHSAASLSADPTGCKECHQAEVEGFERSAMGNALRVAGREPIGSVETPDARITVESSAAGTWQVLDSHGVQRKFHVAYVIGSGLHARGYLVDIGSHLFQSPIAYYVGRHAYGLAPGYEKEVDPDFTRPVTPACLFCHSGEAAHVPGTINEYQSRVTSIGCARCHGSLAAHLADPGPGNIVNPAKLPAAARGAVCEQCHLFGAARVLNPGHSLNDFHAGQKLESTLTIYRNVLPPGTAGSFKVISQAEELSLSMCARKSGGKLWCGTCHNPHETPADPVAYYRAKCLVCHNTGFPASHPGVHSNCIGCHMPTREVSNGGHTAFTDHRIQIRPEPRIAITDETGIAAWREPAPALRERNLGIADIQVGVERGSSTFIIRGYRLLTQVQTEFPKDSDLYTWMGTALLMGRQYSEAERAFQVALDLDPNSDIKQANAGRAYASAGDFDKAKPYLERALQLDPLDLETASLLIKIDKSQGNLAEAAQISSRTRRAMQMH
ncbi:MAG: tetratricopeptide repeat protein [Acidobacteriaceae bacterium]